MTTFARAVSGVERERTRLERRHVDAAIHARHPFRVELLFAVDNRNEHGAASQLQRRSNRIGQSLANAGLDQQPIDDRFDRVISSFVEPNLFVERQQFAIDTRADETFFRELLELFLELAFAAANDRREHHHAFAFGQSEHVLHDLIDALSRDRRAADVTVRTPTDENSRRM